MTIYQANRREVVFDGHHPAFSAAFEALLRRTDAHSSDHVATFTVEAGASGQPARHVRSPLFPQDGKERRDDCRNRGY